MSDTNRIEIESSYDRDECPGCGGRVSSLEWDGYCYSCAHRKVESIDLERRARHLSERLVLTLSDPLASPQVAYQAAVWAAHAARDVIRDRKEMAA